jgi:hypothetical protein
LGSLHVFKLELNLIQHPIKITKLVFWYWSRGSTSQSYHMMLPDTVVSHSWENMHTDYNFSYQRWLFCMVVKPWLAACQPATVQAKAKAVPKPRCMAWLGLASCGFGLIAWRLQAKPADH